MPQSRKQCPFSMLGFCLFVLLRFGLVYKQHGLFCKINILLICIMYKPSDICKQTPEPQDWCAVSQGQVCPNVPGDSVLPFWWPMERKAVWDSWEKLFSLRKDSSSGCFKTGRSQRYFLSNTLFCVMLVEMPILWLSCLFSFRYRIIRWPSIAVSARPISSRGFFVAQKGNTFYSLHETFIVNVYYSETLYCTIKLVLSKLLDVHVFELLSTG